MSENLTTFVQELGRLCRYPATTPVEILSSLHSLLDYGERYGELEPHDQRYKLRKAGNACSQEVYRRALLISWDGILKAVVRSPCEAKLLWQLAPQPLEIRVGALLYPLPQAIVPREIQRRVDLAVGVSITEAALEMEPVFLFQQPEITPLKRIRLPSRDMYVTRKGGKLTAQEYHTSGKWNASKHSYDAENKNKHERRHLLSAQCQVGKTGAYLCLIKLLSEEMRAHQGEEHSECVVVEKRKHQGHELDPNYTRRSAWLLPHWQHLARKSFPLYEKLAPEKYHPKIRLQRLSILVDVLRANLENWKDSLLIALRNVEPPGCEESEARLKELETNLKTLPTPLSLCTEQKEKFKVVDPNALMCILNWDRVYFVKRSPVSRDLKDISFTEAFSFLTDQPTLNRSDQLTFRTPSFYVSSIWDQPPTLKHLMSEVSRCNSETLSPNPYYARAVPIPDHLPDSSLLMFTSPELGVLQVSIPRGDDSYFATSGDRITRAKPVVGDRAIRSWIFTPSYQRAAFGCPPALLDLTKAIERGVAYRQVVVVRPGEQFNEYRHRFGTTCAIMSLPESLLCGERWVSPATGSIGYARRAIQMIAWELNIPAVWMIDDTTLDMYQLEGPPSADALPEPASWSQFMMRVEGWLTDEAVSVENVRIKSIGKRGMEANMGTLRPQKEDADIKELTTKHLANNCRSFVGGQSAVAIVGCGRDINDYVRVGMRRGIQPFSVTPSVYSMYWLNVEATVSRDVLYMPRSTAEDREFNFKCEEKGLAVVKCNMFWHRKKNAQRCNSFTNPTPSPLTVSLTVEVRSLDGVLPKSLTLGQYPVPATVAAVRDSCVAVNPRMIGCLFALGSRPPSPVLDSATLQELLAGADGHVGAAAAKQGEASNTGQLELRLLAYWAGNEPFLFPVPPSTSVITAPEMSGTATSPETVSSRVSDHCFDVWGKDHVLVKLPITDYKTISWIQQAVDMPQSPLVLCLDMKDVLIRLNQNNIATPISTISASDIFGLLVRFPASISATVKRVWSTLPPAAASAGAIGVSFTDASGAGTTCAYSSSKGSTAGGTASASGSAASAFGAAPAGASGAGTVWAYSSGKGSTAGGNASASGSAASDFGAAPAGDSGAGAACAYTSSKGATAGNSGTAADGSAADPAENKGQGVRSVKKQNKQKQKKQAIPRGIHLF
jgi:hypothetical protein